MFPDPTPSLPFPSATSLLRACLSSCPSLRASFCNCSSTSTNNSSTTNNNSNQRRILRLPHLAAPCKALHQKVRGAASHSRVPPMNKNTSPNRNQMNDNSSSSSSSSSSSTLDRQRRQGRVQATATIAPCLLSEQKWSQTLTARKAPRAVHRALAPQPCR